jgi:hypothetical protein
MRGLWELRRPEVRETYKMSFSTKKEYSNQCQDFIYYNDRIYLVTKIDDTEDTVIFDSGSNSTFLRTKSDTTGIHKAYKWKVRLPEGKKELYMHHYYCNIENNLVNAQNCICKTTYTPVLPFSCISQSDMKIIGQSLFFGNEKKTMFLDFSNHKICLYDSLSFDTSQYVLVESSITKGNVIYIYITINNIKQKFLFDTGCPYYFMLNKKQAIPIVKNDLLLDGSFASTHNGIITTDTSIIRKEMIHLSPVDSLAVYSFYMSHLDGNLAGILFISQFDWIIDTKNGKIYAKSINNVNNDSTATITTDRDFVYIVAAMNNRLTIVNRILSNNPIYPLGAKIKSVNGEDITSENICSYRDLLNNTSNWEVFQLEFF